MTGSSGAMERVLSLAEPLAQSMGLEVLLLETGTEHGRRVLRIYLDKAGGGEGVTIEDCAEFSSALDPIIEVEGGLGVKYELEVSSPGLNRPLVKIEHFKMQEGKIIDVFTQEMVEGRHHFKGELIEVNRDDDLVFLRMKVDNKEFEVPYNAIKKAHLDYFASETALKDSKKMPKSKKK